MHHRRKSSNGSTVLAAHPFIVIDAMKLIKLII